MSAFAHIWRWLRRVSGDDAYELYVAHLRAVHPERTPPARAEFYREHEAGKWNGINRCC